jgi:hypothetical protein
VQRGGATGYPGGRVSGPLLRKWLFCSDLRGFPHYALEDPVETAYQRYQPVCPAGSASVNVQGTRCTSVVPGYTHFRTLVAVQGSESNLLLVGCHCPGDCGTPDVSLALGVV